MAIDKLVDSAKLDAALTSTADAIRMKTKGAAAIPFDLTSSTGFSDEIAKIALGITPTGSTTITANGTYDVTDKAQAIVNVPFSGGTELTAIEVYVADLTDTTSYTISKGAVDGYKRQVTA